MPKTDQVPHHQLMVQTNTNDQNSQPSRRRSFDGSPNVGQEGAGNYGSEPNWWSFRFNGKCPDRRAYHSTFVNDDTLYVFGGKDISVGHLNSLWSIDLSSTHTLVQGQSEHAPNPEWKLVKTGGNPASQPNPIANHTSVVFDDKMYLFGGSGGMCENIELFCLDLHSYQWGIVKPQAANNDKSNLPMTRDEHSCVIHDDSMVVFGGFMFGERTNSIFKYHFRKNQWEQIHPSSEEMPCERVGHSAIIKYDAENGDCMYIFGGKDEENKTKRKIRTFFF